jgi:CBS domain-containing protein
MAKEIYDSGLGMFVFFSELLGRAVVDEKGATLGRLVDLKVRLGELFPKVVTLRVKRRREKEPASLAWSEVASLSGNIIKLKTDADKKLKAADLNQEEILLHDELLDKQVVDTHGAKIERVNDIHLLIANTDLRLVHVDIGIRGIFRRLGWLKSVDSFTNWLFAYQLREKMVSWKYVQPLAADLHRESLKLNVNLGKLRDIHPSDLADILEELDQGNRKRVFKALDVQTAAETLEELDPKLQVSLLESAPAEIASDILEEMAPDEATDLLADLSEDHKQRLIETIEQPHRETLEELLRFEEGTAGSIMTKDFISLEDNKNIGDAIEEFRKVRHPLDSIAYIYVTDKDKRLAGVLTLRHLIICDKASQLSKLMNAHLVKVKSEDDVDDVMEIFKKYKFMALPVVDDEDHLAGIITLKDIVESKH